MTKRAQAAPPTPPVDQQRRARLLEAALATFARFGFRKTSMEEVARAARLSRQGLYLHFATKEELFVAAVRHALDTALAAASAWLRDPARAVEAQLAGGFDEWIGRYVGLLGGDVSDLQDATDLLLGSIIGDYEQRFAEALTRAVRASRLPAVYRAAGLNARQLADTLYATARGLKHDCATRADFNQRFGLALRALCLPLTMTRD